jgi:NADH dehydrogenase [ubiquinone] 1 alpha subcomplex assembly factor 7
MTTGGDDDTPLSWLLKAQIRHSGPMSVSDYMSACLQHPEFGYYARRRAIGADGDFITAPEISQVFGEIIGLWCAVVWQQMGEPGRIHLVELGPGRGTLMADALRSARMVPAFRRALAVHLVESNTTLSELQKERLASESGVLWHRSWPETFSDAPVIVIANEFFDALPAEQYVWDGAAWRRRMIALTEADGFTFQLGDAAHFAWPGIPQTGDVREMSPAQAAFVDHFARHANAGLAALIVDYGSASDLPGDTLQAVKAHAYVSPFVSPGAADLTTHVNFAEIARLALGRDLRVDGPVTQAEFLGTLGVVQRVSRLMAANPDKASTLEAGAARLLAPNGMGGRFKAIGLRGPGVLPLPGLQ